MHLIKIFVSVISFSRDNNSDWLFKRIVSLSLYLSDKSFAIAGGICNVQEIKALADKFPNITLLGYVENLDDFWHSKYDEDEDGRAVRKESADQMLIELEEEGLNPSENIVLPNP